MSSEEFEPATPFASQAGASYHCATDLTDAGLCLNVFKILSQSSYMNKFNAWQYSYQIDYGLMCSCKVVYTITDISIGKRNADLVFDSQF